MRLRLSKGILQVSCLIFRDSLLYHPVPGCLMFGQQWVTGLSSRSLPASAIPATGQPCNNSRMCQPTSTPQGGRLLSTRDMILLAGIKEYCCRQLHAASHACTIKSVWLMGTWSEYFVEGPCASLQHKPTLFVDQTGALMQCAGDSPTAPDSVTFSDCTWGADSGSRQTSLLCPCKGNFSA